MKNIASAFIKAKQAFAPALKDKTNPAFRSKYADLGACIEAVDDALLNNGIAMYQETSEDPTGVTVETVLLHESGESIRSGKLHVPAAKQDPQGYGSALTYARRYSLMAACGIAPEDDDGNAGTKAKQAVSKAEKEAQAKREARGAELDELALYLIDCHQNNNDMEAIALWYAPDTFIKEDEQEERLYVWGLLKKESKLRATIKANHPDRVEGQAEAA